MPPRMKLLQLKWKVLAALASAKGTVDPLTFERVERVQAERLFDSLSSSSPFASRYTRFTYDGELQRVTIRFDSIAHSSAENFAISWWADWFPNLPRAYQMFFFRPAGRTFRGFYGQCAGSVKEPDYSIIPNSANFPSLVIEADMSAGDELVRDKNIWIQGSGGATKVVLLLTVKLAGDSITAFLEICRPTSTQKFCLLPESPQMKDDDPTVTLGSSLVSQTSTLVEKYSTTASQAPTSTPTTILFDTIRPTQSTRRRAKLAKDVTRRRTIIEPTAPEITQEATRTNQPTENGSDAGQCSSIGNSCYKDYAEQPQVKCPNEHHILYTMDSNPESYFTMPEIPRRIQHRPDPARLPFLTRSYFRELRQQCHECNCGYELGIITPGTSNSACPDEGISSRCSNWMACFCEAAIKHPVPSVTYGDKSEVLEILQSFPLWMRRQLIGFKITHEGIDYSFPNDDLLEPLNKLPTSTYRLHNAVQLGVQEPGEGENGEIRLDVGHTLGGTFELRVIHAMQAAEGAVQMFSNRIAKSVQALKQGHTYSVFCPGDSSAVSDSGHPGARSGNVPTQQARSSESTRAPGLSSNVFSDLREQCSECTCNWDGAIFKVSSGGASTRCSSSEIAFGCENTLQCSCKLEEPKTHTSIESTMLAGKAGGGKRFLDWMVLKCSFLRTLESIADARALILNTGSALTDEVRQEALPIDEMYEHSEFRMFLWEWIFRRRLEITPEDWYPGHLSEPLDKDSNEFKDGIYKELGQIIHDLRAFLSWYLQDSLQIHAIYSTNLQRKIVRRWDGGPKSILEARADETEPSRFSDDFTPDSANAALAALGVFETGPTIICWEVKNVMDDLVTNPGYYKTRKVPSDFGLAPPGYEYEAPDPLKYSGRKPGNGGPSFDWKGYSWGYFDRLFETCLQCACTRDDSEATLKQVRLTKNSGSDCDNDFAVYQCTEWLRCYCSSRLGAVPEDDGGPAIYEPKKDPDDDGDGDDDKKPGRKKGRFRKLGQTIKRIFRIGKGSSRYQPLDGADIDNTDPHPRHQVSGTKEPYYLEGPGGLSRDWLYTGSTVALFALEQYLFRGTSKSGFLSKRSTSGVTRQPEDSGSTLEFGNSPTVPWGEETEVDLEAAIASICRLIQQNPTWLYQDGSSHISFNREFIEGLNIACATLGRVAAFIL
ncbi:hypothetical protein Dda_7209 [Drechslerella dactyloides]|uniref:Uncharacterized protein n=1 Tax=Drechslerella dactyloides TaxID=74499 RepID=A0AAD6ITC0_DREDA|nr:hypothetical protein Dda_7209 [Drechslerella dactyloides]